MNLTLRCFALAYGNQWHAICTDLDVAADGDSFDEARASLATCIELYLDGIDELPAPEQGRLLNRKSPWHVRAKMATLSWLHRLRGHNASSLGFVLESHTPIPVPG